MSTERFELPFYANGNIYFLEYPFTGHADEYYQMLASAYRFQLGVQQREFERRLKLQWNNPVDEPEVNYAQLTSFLEVDDSFFSPWNRELDEKKADMLCSEGKKYMHFEPGSFFSNEEFCCVKPKHPSNPQEIENTDEPANLEHPSNPQEIDNTDEPANPGHDERANPEHPSDPQEIDNIDESANPKHPSDLQEIDNIDELENPQQYGEIGSGNEIDDEYYYNDFIDRYYDDVMRLKKEGKL